MSGFPSLVPISTKIFYIFFAVDYTASGYFGACYLAGVGNTSGCTDAVLATNLIPTCRLADRSCCLHIKDKMASLNKVILIGHLGRDAETKFLGSGTSVTSFSLATSYKPKSGDEKTEWHNIECFGKESISEYLLKGKQIYVEGRIQTDTWEDKDSGEKKYRTKIVGENIVFLSAKAKEEF